MILFLIRLMCTLVGLVLSPIYGTIHIVRKTFQAFKVIWSIDLDGYIKISKGETNFSDYDPWM